MIQKYEQLSETEFCDFQWNHKGLLVIGGKITDF